jgi:hypothetical protein
MQPETLDKIKALFTSQNEGERAAAHAAWERVKAAGDAKRLVRNTPEWDAAAKHLNEMLCFCASRLGSPRLKPAEVKMLRNWVRYRGQPDSAGLPDFIKVYDKLKDAEA